MFLSWEQRAGLRLPVAVLDIPVAVVVEQPDILAAGAADWSDKLAVEVALPFITPYRG